ncbi:MAG: ribonuclease E/G [Fusobacteria bacterium]|nr:ribonuclease E/G [Fusobacteriota bacterium]
MEILFWRSISNSLIAVRLYKRKLFDIAYEKNFGVGAVCVGRVVKQSRASHFLVDFGTFQGFLEVKEHKIDEVVEKVKNKSLHSFELTKEPEGKKLTKVKLCETQEVLHEATLGSMLKNSSFFSEKVCEWISKGVSKIFFEDATTLKLLKEKIHNFEAHCDYEINSFNKKLRERFEIDKAIENLYRKNIYSESGSYINIEKCVALTVIDVNSGNHTKSSFEVNSSILEELVRAIVLRDISGVIIVDFINMKHKNEELEFHECVKKAFDQDGRQINLLGFTRGRLYEVVRQKKENSIESSEKMKRLLI